MRRAKLSRSVPLGSYNTRRREASSVVTMTPMESTTPLNQVRPSGPLTLFHLNAWPHSKVDSKSRGPGRRISNSSALPDHSAASICMPGTGTMAVSASTVQVDIGFIYLPDQLRYVLKLPPQVRHQVS